MPKTIPVKAAQAVAEEQKCKQVIIAAWDGKLTHVVTYGMTDEDKAQAAHGGNKIKATLGWDESTYAQPPIIEALQKEIAVLKKTLREQPISWVVEMTERDRFSGPRPDGYIGFKTEEAAKKFVRTATAGRSSTSVPDEYIAYSMPRPHPCNFMFKAALNRSASEQQYFNNLSELMSWDK